MVASAIDELAAGFDEPFARLGRDADADRGAVLISWPAVPVELVRAAGFRPVVAHGSARPTPAADGVLEPELFPARLRQLVEAALTRRLGQVAAIDVLVRDDRLAIAQGNLGVGTHVFARHVATTAVPGLDVDHRRILGHAVDRSQLDHVFFVERTEHQIAVLVFVANGDHAGSVGRHVEVATDRAGLQPGRQLFHSRAVDR